MSPTVAPPTAAAAGLPGAPPESGPGQTQSGPRGWLWRLRTVHAVLRMAALSATAGLLFWALMPAAFGWEPALVVSGSMMPAVRPGDIVVAAPVPAATLARGMIVLVDDPAMPGTLLLHRVVGRTADGALITKGDANHDRDRAPVPLARVHGGARLRVPYAGLPALWLRSGQTVPLLALALALAVLAWPERRDPTSARHRARTSRPGRHPAG